MLKERINRLKDKKDDVDILAKLSYTLCKTFGWDYYTLQKQPLPFVWMLINQMNNENKELNKSKKK